MKKIAVILTAFVMALFVVSCGGGDSETPTEPSGNDTPDSNTETPDEDKSDSGSTETPDAAADTDPETDTDTDSNSNGDDTDTEEPVEEEGPCAENPCAEDETCTVDATTEEGYICTCIEGKIRPSETVCGSTQHGKLYQKCENGDWAEKCTCDPGEYPEVCGYYAQKMWFTSKSKVFTIDLAEGWTRTYFHIVQEQEQDKIHIKATYCNIKIDNSMSSVLQVVMPQSFADALGTADKEAVLTKNDDGTFGYKQDIFWEIRGIDPACYGDKPEDYVLPENSNDPCVQDWDNDGLPGITVTAKGTMSGTMGMVEKSSSIIRDGYFEENGVLKAYVDWTDKQKILYTTNQMLKDGSDNQIKDESSKFDGPAKFIEQVKIEDGSDCAFIVNNAGTIFSPDPVNLK